MLDLRYTAVGNEEELVSAIKKHREIERVVAFRVSPEQEKWISKLPTFYNHNVKNKVVKEYYSPFGEHLVEVSDE